ncbi:hypothetical protein DFQ28_001359 [Apophysomyces sp. BC1034]|nr:hypothetical protein DFQ28_001359 [Apophysomyces sp. BC1034]
MICQNLAQYKVKTTEERETLWDNVTETAHDLLNSLKTVDEQQRKRKRSIIPEHENENEEPEYELIRQARNLQENARPKNGVWWGNDVTLVTLQKLLSGVEVLMVQGLFAMHVVCS